VVDGLGTLVNVVSLLNMELQFSTRYFVFPSFFLNYCILLI
jgi:hypothetical protein